MRALSHINKTVTGLVNIHSVEFIVNSTFFQINFYLDEDLIQR